MCFNTTHIMQFIEKHKLRPQISTELSKSKSSGNLLGSLQTEVTALSHSDLSESVSFRLPIFDLEKLKISWLTTPHLRDGGSVQSVQLKHQFELANEGPTTTELQYEEISQCEPIRYLLVVPCWRLRRKPLYFLLFVFPLFDYLYVLSHGYFRVLYYFSRDAKPNIRNWSN